MKKIIRIARVEVLSLFYMPVAWLILIAFIIQTGTDFFTEAYRYGVGNSLGYLVHDFITYHLFYDRYVGLFTLLKTKLIYYIPLLTMGVISKEISSGSIKLLLSSPVKISEFVLGKFFGVAIFNLFFIAVLMIYGIISLFVVENMDWPAVLSGLLGIYLLICTYAAVGVFVSSLTSYQAVAALLTLAILFSMNNISIVWQNYDFFRDLTYNLSLSGRIEVFISGLITTRDVIYYLMMITAFLGLTMMRLSFNRQMMPFSARLPRYALLILAVAGIGYISGRPKLIGYWDVTANQGQSLSPQGQEIMKKFKQPVEVTTYVNLLEENYNRFKPQIRNGDLLNLEPYRRFHRDMEFNYVNYYDTTPRSWQINANYGMSIPDIAKKVAKAEGKSLDYYLSPKEIRKKIDLSSVENRIIREFKMGNRRATIMGTFLGELPEEKEMLVPFKMLLGSEPKVLGFVQGHNERELDAPRGLKMLTSDIEGKKSLCNNGFVSKAVSLKEEIPANLTALVIADPKFDYAADEMERLQRYIDDGGNVLIFGEIRKKEVVDKLIAPLGLKFMDATLLSNDKNSDQNLIVTKIAQYPDDTTEYKAGITDSSLCILPIDAGAFEQIPAIRQFNVFYSGVIDTSRGWLRPGKLDMTDSSRIEFNKSSGDKKEAAPTLVRLTRKVNGKDQKIMVVGDADMLSQPKDYGTFDIIHSIMRFVSSGEFPVKVTYLRSKDNRFFIGKKEVLTLKNICLVVIPSLIFISGAVVLIRRKRK